MTNQPLLTDQEVADLFRVSRTTIWNWVRAENGFPAPARYNGTTRWKRAELEDYIENGAR